MGETGGNEGADILARGSVRAEDLSSMGLLELLRTMQKTPGAEVEVTVDNQPAVSLRSTTATKVMDEMPVAQPESTTVPTRTDGSLAGLPSRTYTNEERDRFMAELGEYDLL